MKYIILFCALLVLRLDSSEGTEGTQLKKEELLRNIFINLNTYSERQLTANINDYMDVVFQNLKTLFVTNGYDPMKMPDVHEAFERRILLIKYKGNLDLTKGWLHELTTIRRNGNVIAKYSDLFLRIQIPIKFETLMFSYDYSAKFMHLGPTGGLDGQVQNVQLYADVLLDLKELQVYIQEVELRKVGKISVKFSGHGLVDWFTNIISDIATAVLHRVVVGKFQNEISELMEKMAAQINEDLKNISLMVLNIINLIQHETTISLTEEVEKLPRYLQRKLKRERSTTILYAQDALNTEKSPVDDSLLKSYSQQRFY